MKTQQIAAATCAVCASSEEKPTHAEIDKAEPFAAEQLEIRAPK